MEASGHSDYFADIASAHTYLRDFGWLLEQCWVSFLRLVMFSGIEVVCDIMNPFDPWQLVTVRTDSITNIVGLP